MRTAVGRVINEQEDLRKTVEELARRIDTFGDGTHPREGPTEAGTQSNAGVAMQLELIDLKTKVFRLTDKRLNIVLIGISFTHV